MLYQYQCQKEGSIFYYQHGGRNPHHLIQHCPICGSKKVEPTGREYPDLNERLP